MRKSNKKLNTKADKTVNINKELNAPVSKTINIEKR